MLAAQCDDMDALKYPLLATPKIDGIRCLIIKGVAMSRSLKPIPNAYIQSVLGHREYNGLDGELLVGSTFQQATSGIMSEGGEPDFMFNVFDTWDDPAGYAERSYHLRKVEHLNRVHVLMPRVILSRPQLDGYVEGQLALGYEGVMVRNPDGPYKFGRATFKEGYLTKIKPFEDDEAIVVGCEERMHNANVATTNALGRTERSSHKANLVPRGTLGALIVTHPTYGEFNIGTGFDDATRQEIWDSFHTNYVHSTVKFRYQKIGTKDKPRCPVFLGFRHGDDK